MHVTPYDVVGAEVTDLDLADPVDDDLLAEMQGLLAEHGVLVMPGQTIDDTQFSTFLRLFGDPVFTVGETAVDGFDDLNVISNVGRTTPPRSTFHVDTSYVSRPPAYTALRAVTVPTHGGQTLFSSQYRAHDTLDDATRERLDGVTITHRVTGVDPGETQEHQADHPVLRPHPLSGRSALYLTTPARCVAVSGCSEAEGHELVERLYAHSIRDDNLLRHAWRPGDVVMWDNGCVLHKADHSGVVGDRVMHRGMATGYAG